MNQSWTKEPKIMPFDCPDKKSSTMPGSNRTNDRHSPIITEPIKGHKHNEQKSDPQIDESIHKSS
jgi:hypothetical protein